jgi:hypothetical protein
MLPGFPASGFVEEAALVAPVAVDVSGLGDPEGVEGVAGLMAAGGSLFSVDDGLGDADCED